MNGNGATRAQGTSRTASQNQILTTAVGLQIPDDLSYHEWARAGQKLNSIAATAAWCLGDWLVYGENRYASKYREAIACAGLDYQTLRNYAWVARRIDMPRRRESLSFQHHAEVAPLDAEAQDEWLRLAEDNEWSRNELRRRIKGQGGKSKNSDEVATVPRLPVTHEQMQHWRDAAAMASLPLETWLVLTLNDAAARVLTGSTEPAEHAGIDALVPEPEPEGDQR